MVRRNANSQFSSKSSRPLIQNVLQRYFVMPRRRPVIQSYSLMQQDFSPRWTPLHSPRQWSSLNGRFKPKMQNKGSEVSVILKAMCCILNCPTWQIREELKIWHSLRNWRAKRSRLIKKLGIFPQPTPILSLARLTFG